MISWSQPEPEQPQQSPTPGWYPISQFEQRYWDGQTWTKQTATLLTTPASREPSSTAARKLASISWLALVIAIPLAFFSLVWVAAALTVAAAALACLACLLAIIGLSRGEGSSAAWPLISGLLVLVVFVALVTLGSALGT